MFPGWKIYVDESGDKTKLKSIQFLILSNINAKGPINGYSILTDFKERFANVWNPSPGTIYNQLESLENKNLIYHKYVETDKEHLRSKEYTITQKGKKVLTKIIDVETAEQEFEFIGDYIKAIMQRLPFDQRFGPFYRFMSPLFEMFERPHKHHKQHRPPHPPPHPPPPGAPPPPDYDSFIDALKQFKHVCVNYCDCHEQEKSPKSKATESNKESKGKIIPTKGDDD